MAITGIGGGASTIPPTIKAKGTGLDAATFMKLFTTQIANQNPMEPQNSADFLNQFAQITSVQTMNELQTTMQDVKGGLSSLQNTNQFSQAASLLGKTIGFIDATGALKQDQVKAIQINTTGNVQLSITGGVLVDVTAVRQVL